MTIPGSQYNTVSPLTGRPNNYGPAQPANHSGQTNRAFDQFYEDIADQAALKKAKVDGPFTQIFKKLVKAFK